MGLAQHRWRIESAQQGVRLDHFLAEALPRALGRAVTRSQVRRLIMAGAVRRNGRPERIASIALKAGTAVEARVDLAKLDSAGPHGVRREVVREFAWTPERILFEDAWLIAVDKPPGLPTQPTLDAGRANVFATLGAYLQQRDGRAAYLGLHHRLDRDTSGVLVFTKDPAANAGLAAQFAGREMQKTYHALAVAGPERADTWEVRNHLGVVGRVGKASKFGAVRKGGDPAHTTFRVLARGGGLALVEAQPHTGRTHQIRVHLAEGGQPICGDIFYGGPAEWRGGHGAAVRFPRVLLHAAALEFRHPVTQAPLVVRSPLPEDFARGVAEAGLAGGGTAGRGG